MEQHTLILFLLFINFFLFISSLLQAFSKKYPIPYTVTLLVAGLISQLVGRFFHMDTVHFTLSHDIIYYILLPLLLFESSYHIHVHQFRLQFKTISFLATFGLLVSFFVIGLGMTWLLELPLGVSLLFGALISATDPIAVITLFKTLGAPKRLGLIADGESMFNDATAIITYRIISGFVLTSGAFDSRQLFNELGNFLYMFIGSMILGGLLGYFTSRIIAKVRGGNTVETTLTVFLALFSFIAAEHFFHLSGVISSVIAGIVLGHFGRTKISKNARSFVREWWGYIAFLCVSLVFFFASFNLNLSLFQTKPLILLTTIFLVLLARTVSVYFSIFITNHAPFFNDEPDIPSKWQHILNWGGLRGVIPLVLVYSLPDSFQYKELILAITLSTLIFTLVINGLSIQWLLIKLRLHLPRVEEEIINEEMNIFDTEEKRKRLDELSDREFDLNILYNVDLQLQEKESNYKEHLLKLARSKQFLRSIQLQALKIERRTLQKLFTQGRFTENVFYEFETELDLQQDGLEYPELYKRRAAQGKEIISTHESFRKRILKLRRLAAHLPIFQKIFQITEEDIVRERYGLLRARIFTSYAVLGYLNAVEKIFLTKTSKKAISRVRSQQQRHIENNKKEIKKIAKSYPELTNIYQKDMVTSLIISTPFSASI